jgi:hypothetical protein
VKALYCPFVAASLRQYDTSHIFSTLHNKPALSAPQYLSEEGNVSDKTLAYLTDLKSTTYRVVPDLYHTELTKHNEYKSSPITGLEWPRGFQEVKVLRLHDNGTGWW